MVPAWRNRDAELTALTVAALAARLSGARVAAAHVSHVDAMTAAAGLIVECCPQYLTLLEEEILERGAFRKFTPPARARGSSDIESMWRALADGRIDYVSSDHAPSTPQQKRSGSIWDVHFGLPGIDTTLSVLLDGASAGRISYERVVEVYAEAPSRLYGLWPAKGRLAPGADGDVILVDPTKQWTVRDEDVVSRASWSPYTGRTLTGRAIRTYLRGQIVADEGSITGNPGMGQFIRGAGQPKI